MALLSRDPFDFSDATIVTIHVGPEPKKFHVHKVLLCKESSFFKAALEGNFKEASTNTIELLNEDVSTFTKLLCWLYCGVLKSETRAPRDQNQVATAGWDKNKVPTADLNGLVDLYGLSDRLGVEGLPEVVLELFHQQATSSSNRQFLDVCGKVFNQPSSDTPLHRMTTAALVWNPSALGSCSTEEMRQLLSRCPGLGEQLAIGMHSRHIIGQSNPMGKGWRSFTRSEGEADLSAMPFGKRKKR